ncbi:hypothetical protein BN2475_160032 [Paraburkholderia ribeironis]|uniref:Uncharacterized protein n=1 Tax=Paraburkholderia ribeironis TaxID=1247936 RepID=A0A1N7RU67_9BURK|nr:hypothetical protein BN2475_160032 [Paraburkholderia ribeironis]
MCNLSHAKYRESACAWQLRRMEPKGKFVDINEFVGEHAGALCRGSSFGRQARRAYRTGK